MAAYIRPDFVSLDEPSVDAANVGVPQLSAPFARCFEQGKNCVLVYVRQSGDCTNGHSFEHHGKNLRGLLRRDVVVSDLAVRLAECSFAGLAAPALNAALTEVTESLAGLVLASFARHGFSPLDFWRKKPLNLIEVRMRASSASGLAPQPVCAGSGALNVSYVLGWWLDRDLYGLTGSECDLDSDHAVSILSESPVYAGLSYLTPKSFLRPQGLHPSLRFTRSERRLDNRTDFLRQQIRINICKLCEGSYLLASLIGRLAVLLGNTQFSGIVQPTNNSVDVDQEILGRGCLKTARDQRIPNFHGREMNRCDTQDRSYLLRQSLRYVTRRGRQFVSFILRQLFQILNQAEKHASALFQRLQLTLGLMQSGLEAIFHIGGYTECV